MSARASTMWLLAAVLSLLAPSARAAETSVVLGAAELDKAAGEVTLLVGAMRADGSPAKLGDVTLLLDGKSSCDATARTKMTEYAVDHPKWTPPLAVGLVYLWTPSVTPKVMEGIEALFRRLPSRTSVYPTPYGVGYRPAVTRTPASRIASGELGHYEPIPEATGRQYKLIDAVTFNAKKLAEDEAPIKHLVLVTDGRDYRAGDQPAAFIALGNQLKKAHIRLEVVSFPDQVDKQEGAANVRDLVQSAHGLHLPTERPDDLPALIESLSETVGGLWRVRFPVPWSASTFGGERAVGVRVVADGVEVTGEGGRLTFEGSGGGLIWGLGILVLCGGLGVGGFVMWRKLSASGGGGGGGGGAKRRAAMLDLANELVRKGAKPERAVVELTRAYPKMVRELLQMNPAELSPQRHRFLRTRAGQARLKDIQALLSADDDEQNTSFDDELAAILANALSERESPEDTAEQLQSRLPSERLAKFGRAKVSEVAKLLGQAKGRYPSLASPRARGFALSVQDALTQPERDAAPAITIGWLVQASGPGVRGSTRRLANPRTLIGRGAQCNLRVTEDPNVADEHAEVVLTGEEYVVTPKGGAVRVEGRDVDLRHHLVDGHTLEIGGSRFVFKAVRSN